MTPKFAQILEIRLIWLFIYKEILKNVNFQK